MPAWPARLVPADIDPPTDMVAAIRDELTYLWNDLADAIRHADGGCWSGGCESLTSRIVALTAVLGAGISWKSVPTVLVAGGTYQRIHHEAGFPHPPIDPDALAAAQTTLADGARVG